MFITLLLPGNDIKSKYPEEYSTVVCENSRFLSLFAADGRDLSRAGTSATQRQKFNTGDVNSVRNPVISAKLDDGVVTLFYLLFTNDRQNTKGYKGQM